MDNNSGFLDCLNSTRFAILLAIIRSGKPVMASEIARISNLSPMTVSRHISHLEDGDFIAASHPRTGRNGKRVTYWPTDKARDIFDAPRETLAEAWIEHDKKAPQK